MLRSPQRGVCGHTHTRFHTVAPSGSKPFPVLSASMYFLATCNYSPGTLSPKRLSHGKCSTLCSWLGLLSHAPRSPLCSPLPVELTLKLFEASFQHAGVLSGVDVGSWREQEAPGVLRPFYSLIVKLASPVQAGPVHPAHSVPIHGACCLLHGLGPRVHALPTLFQRQALLPLEPGMPRGWGPGSGVVQR